MEINIDAAVNNPFGSTVLASTTGTLTVNASQSLTASGLGIVTTGFGGATDIVASGTITSGLTGIYSTSTTGNITISGGGRGVVTGGDEGITLATASGNVSVQNFASVSGADTGLWLLPVTGNITVSNVGTITGTLGDGIIATTVGGNISIQGAGGVGGINGGGRDGIHANAAGGDISIGNQAANGAIRGFDEGVEAYTGGAGNITITSSQDIVGTIGWGIYSRVANGTIAVDINGGTVQGGTTGIDVAAVGTGNVAVNVGAGAVVQGTLFGLVTGTVTGNAVTNTAGIIGSVGDTGAANTNGGSAIWGFSGNNVVNNTGQIVGHVHSTGSTSFVLENQAGGIWTPGANSGSSLFAGLSDTVNNAGTINIRTGTTTFAGLEAFNNRSGGHINMAYSAAATDNLVVNNIRPMAGSTITFNFDASGSNNAALGFDNSSNGKGTADTIIVTGSATPQDASVVDIVATGGTPGALTGSVALVYTGVNLSAPAAGATLTTSANYRFGDHNPSSGRTTFYLVDDGMGGVYLQWAPNLSPASLGGFGGAIGDAAKASPGSAIAGAAAGGAGVGGVGLGGGPSGGGVTGRVADMAASSVLATTSSVGVGAGAGERASHCQERRSTQAWGQVEGERTTFNGGRSGRSDSLSGGIELDAGEHAGLGCNRLAIGVFGFGATSRAGAVTGASSSETGGLGAYVRLASGAGFYVSMLSAVSWSDTVLSNVAYASTADKDSQAFSAVASIGYLAQLGPSTALDLRGFASHNRNNGDAFTDSSGIAVSDARDELRTYGFGIGLHRALNPSLQGFVRGGVKWADLDSTVTAFGNTLKGSLSDAASSVEAGFVGNLGNGVEFGASSFGTFSDGARGVGGRAHLGIKF